ncbi:hypothetical protein DFH09DRAFT_1279507 [Mycena vulgaris]|nr:hypothetical protein DFH09DRAFT_1279507 [Mycena vulgaris]
MHVLTRSLAEEQHWTMQMGRNGSLPPSSPPLYASPPSSPTQSGSKCPGDNPFAPAISDAYLPPFGPSGPVYGYQTPGDDHGRFRHEFTYLTRPNFLVDDFSPASSRLQTPGHGLPTPLRTPHATAFATPYNAIPTPQPYYPPSSTRPGYREAACELCGTDFWLDMKSERVLILHRGSRGCNLKQRQNRQAQERAAAAITLTRTNLPGVRAHSEEPTPQSIRPDTQPTFHNPRCSHSRGREVHPRARSPQRSSSVPVDAHRGAMEAEAEDEDSLFVFPSVPLRPDLTQFDEISFVVQPLCPGIMLDWSQGPIFKTYPWSIHLSDCTAKLGYRPDHFTGEGDDKRIWLRSETCTSFSDPGKSECASRRAVLDGKALHTVETRAENAPAHTPYQYLNQTQLIEMLRTVIAEKNAWQLKLFNMSHQVARTLKRMSDHKRFLMALATHNIPRLHHLIRLAIKQGAGIDEIIWRIEEAVKRLYNVKSYTETEKQFVRTIKRMAGRKAVYAMSKFLGLPSASTIAESDPPRLLPSVNVPKPSEIATNISTFFGPPPPGSSPSPKIIGLCREHSGNLDLSMTDMESVLGVLDAVHGDAPACHYGREATVAAIGPFRADNYHGLPIVQTQTCKSEKGKGFAALLTSIFE